MMREITVGADVKNIAAVTDFVDELLEAASCPMRPKIQLDVAIDELFSNVARYAYGSGSGEVTVRAEIDENSGSAALTFIDRGTPFNPLMQAEPALTLPAEQRQIGGLGIMMVRKSMDEMQYEYAAGENRLRVVKRW